MKSSATTVEQYIEDIPQDRKEGIEKLRAVILENLPKGFEEGISYGMIGYYVPHKIYPEGYHCNPKLPLPFMSFANQKNSINFYNMELYVNPELYNWFVTEFPKYSTQKLDMGKSCIRFKKYEHIPFELIAQLVRKVTVEDWISSYESKYKQ
jgi:uncharacterized protein YdhG (YjbR/CyaY superfamily)